MASSLRRAIALLLVWLVGAAGGIAPGNSQPAPYRGWVHYDGRERPTYFEDEHACKLERAFRVDVGERISPCYEML